MNYIIKKMIIIFWYIKQVRYKYKKLFRKIMKKTMNIIKKNKAAIKAVAIELAEKSILSPDEIKIILDDLA